MPTQKTYWCLLTGRPWQKVAADFFNLNVCNYLLVVAYSRYGDVAKLTPARSEAVLVHLKSIFSQHDIPGNWKWTTVYKPTVSVLCSTVWVETHHQQPQVCSKYWRGTGPSSDSEMTAKESTRSLPCQSGIAPQGVETLFIPYLWLMPALSDKDYVASKERERRIKETASFNRRHCVRDLSPLTPGQNGSWMQRLQAQ